MFPLITVSSIMLLKFPVKILRLKSLINLCFCSVRVQGMGRKDIMQDTSGKRGTWKVGASVLLIGPCGACKGSSTCIPFLGDGGRIFSGRMFVVSV